MKIQFLSLMVLFSLPFIGQSQITLGSYDKELKINVNNLDQIKAPEASSDCGEVEMSKTEAIFSGGCLGNLVITYTFKDECGNVANAEQFCLLVDTDGPQFNATPKDLEVASKEDIPEADDMSAEDNSGKEVKISLEEVMEKHQLKRVWTAKDKCGNTSTTEQIIRFHKS
jgi:hypothetical protein